MSNITTYFIKIRKKYVLFLNKKCATFLLKGIDLVNNQIYSIDPHINSKPNKILCFDTR